MQTKTSTSSGLLIAAAIAAAIGIPGCGSSSTSVLQPSNDRCQIAIGGGPSTIPADGGNGSISVSAARECLWSATSESQWLTITSGASGQGDGTVNFQAVSNPAPAMRRGSVVINNSRAEISQAAAPCQYRLGSVAQTFPATGGDGSVDVQTLEGCNWTATSGSSWVAIANLQNPGGSGSVRFRVEPNTGDARTGSLTIAGLSFSVIQSGANVQCNYGIEPTGLSAPAAGGNATIAVTAPGGCGWTAVSQAPWIAVNNGATGNGNGIVNIAVAANTGAARTGTVIVASNAYTVTQAGVSAPCAFAIAPTNQSIAAGGGSATVTVTTAAGCSWTAVSQSQWITVTNGASGNGNGAVALTIAANGGAARTGTVTIAGLTYSVNQAEAPRPCAFTVAPTTIASPVGGGTSPVTVTTESNCSWTAVSQAQWITVTSGGSGSGNGTVTLTIAANGGAARSGTVTVAGHTVTVNQPEAPRPCAYTVAPMTIEAPAAGGPLTVTVTTDPGCSWTAATQADWITVASGAAGSGNGTVTLSVASNSGAARTGSALVAGHTVTINQNGPPPPCSYAINPTETVVGAAGGTTMVAVTTQNSCTWSVTTNTTWIAVTNIPTGNGNGTVELSVAANTGTTPRSGTVTIAGQTFTVTQTAPPTACTYELMPMHQDVSNAGGDFTVQIVTQPGCPWTAVPDGSWIEIAANAGGSGTTTLTYHVQPNPGATRNGRINIATQRLNIMQGPM